MGGSLHVTENDGLVAYAGNHHGRRLLMDWGWGNCDDMDAPNNSPYCNGWAPWFGRWGNNKSEDDSSAAAAPAAATGERWSFMKIMRSCWIFVRDKHGVVFHHWLYTIGYGYFNKAWINILVYLWMRLWGHRPPLPDLNLEFLGL